MKNQFKLLLVAATISLGIFACKGSVNTGDIGTTPPEDSVKTKGIDVKDSHTDTVSSHLDTTKMSSPGYCQKVRYTTILISRQMIYRMS